MPHLPDLIARQRPRVPRRADLIAGLPVPLARAGYRTAFAALKLYWFVARPRTRGVKCVLRDPGGRILLVQHSYGDRGVWELPGGGARTGEAPDAAARREMGEELGADVTGWRILGEAYSARHRRRDTITYLEATWPGGPVHHHPGELEATRWFAPDALPAALGDDVRTGLRFNLSPGPAA